MRIRGIGDGRGRGQGRGRGRGQWRGRGRGRGCGRGQCLPNGHNLEMQPSQLCTDSPCTEPSLPSPGTKMPKFDIDKLIAYEKKKDEVAGQSSAPTNIHGVGESLGPKSMIPMEVVSDVYVKDLIIPPPLKKCKVSRAELSFQNSPFAGIEGYKVKSATNARLALSALNTISQAVSDYVGTMGHLSDEQDVLQKRAGELQKKISEGEKLLNKTQEEKKKAEEDLELARSEIIKLTARLTKVEGHVKKLEEDLAKAKVDLGVAQEKVKELEGELDGTLTEALEQYKAGYAAALCHLKVKSPDFDTSDMTYATKVVEGKLVVRDSDT